ncbi:MAG: DUF615 domain-containing protein, partial [Proteobacteria bacterium]|nr:DUF615 domain-containing protein [Pseudomonadota bacterium]
KLAKQLKRGEALRRQTQHIGALMRSVDSDPIRLLVENIDHIHKKSVDKFHQLETYREQLLNADPDVFGELSTKFPQLDRQHLMQLVRNAIKEKERNKPPKSFRLIFDYLKELTKQSPA